MIALSRMVINNIQNYFDSSFMKRLNQRFEFIYLLAIYTGTRIPGIWSENPMVLYPQ